MKTACKFCNKTYKSIWNHEPYCKQNPNRSDKSGSNNPHFGKKGSNKFIKMREIGKIYIPSEKEKEGRKRTGRARAEIRWKDPEAKIKQSLIMKEAVKRNPESYSSSNVSGRTKLYEITDSLGNIVKVKGTWELLVAKWLDSLNIRWIVPKEGIPYKWNGERLYFPDFYLLDEKRYMEVKGFERERDLEKWKNVPGLIILKINEIKKIKNGILKFNDVAQLA